jgi:cytoskeletal protein CcmA (bactofilin family)
VRITQLRSVGARKLLALVILALLLAGLVAASPVGALETRSGDEVVIGPDEVIEDDLYVTASEVVVDGTVRGDLIAFSGSIVVDGTVEGDLIGAARSVVIGGTVEDDVRIAGQTLLLGEGAEVEDDLIAAGFSLENVPDSAVGGTLMYAGYQALLQGTVGEDVNAAANGLELGGEVGANVDAEVDGEDGGPPPFLFAPQADLPTVDSGLTLTDSATVGGDLTYESSTEARIDPQAQIEGEVIGEERPAEEEEDAYTFADAVFDHLRSFVALLLVGLILIWIAPNWVRRRAGTVLDRPGSIGPRSLPGPRGSHPAGDPRASGDLGSPDLGRSGGTDRRPGVAGRGGTGPGFLDLYELPGPDRRQLPRRSTARRGRPTGPGQRTGLTPGGRPDPVRNPQGHSRARSTCGPGRCVARLGRPLSLDLGEVTPWSRCPTPGGLIRVLPVASPVSKKREAGGFTSCFLVVMQCTARISLL